MFVAWNGNAFEKAYAWPLGVRAVQCVDSVTYSQGLKKRFDGQRVCIASWGAYNELELFVDTSLKDKGILKCSVGPSDTTIGSMENLRQIEDSKSQYAALKWLHKHKTFTLLIWASFTHDDFQKTFSSRRQTLPKLAAIVYCVFLQALDYVESKKHSKSLVNNRKTYELCLRETEEVADNMPAIFRKERKDLKTLLAEGEIVLPPSEPPDNDLSRKTISTTTSVDNASASQTSLVTENSSAYVSAVEDLSDEEDTITEEQSDMLNNANTTVLSHVQEEQEEKQDPLDSCCSLRHGKCSRTIDEQARSLAPCPSLSQVTTLLRSASPDTLESHTASQQQNTDTLQELAQPNITCPTISNSASIDSVAKTQKSTLDLSCALSADGSMELDAAYGTHKLVVDDGTFPSLASTVQSVSKARHPPVLRKLSYAQAATGLSTIPEESFEHIIPPNEEQAKTKTPPQPFEVKSPVETDGTPSETSFTSAGSTAVLGSRSPTHTLAIPTQDLASQMRRPQLARSSTAAVDPTPIQHLHRRIPPSDRSTGIRLSPPYPKSTSSISITKPGAFRNGQAVQPGQLSSALLSEAVTFSYQRPHKETCCPVPSCQQATAFRHSIICPRCGPLSFVRYCSLKHLHADIRRHYAQDGECLRRPNHLHCIDEQSIEAHSKPHRAFIAVSSQMYDSFERHRQATYRSYPAYRFSDADYVIFNDADLISAAMASDAPFSLELLQAYRGRGTVVDYVQFPYRTQAAKKAAFAQQLDKLLWHGTSASAAVPLQCRQLFLSIKENLKSRNVWDVQMADRVIFAMKMEFMYTVEIGDRE